MYANFKRSPRHEDVKKADRIFKESRARKLNFNVDNQVLQFCSKISAFKRLIISGSHYLCVACNRRLYRRSVSLINGNRFSTISDDVFSLVLSFDRNFFKCNTFGKKLNKNCIPCQAVCNMPKVCKLPKEFRDIRKLESVLIARRFLFKKISIMPKGRSPKLKGALCNIPIDVVDVCNTVSQTADSNDIVITKF